MPLLFFMFICFFNLFVRYRSVKSFVIHQECLHKYEVKSQWNTVEKLQIDCFISPNWPWIEILKISIHRKQYFLQNTTLQSNNHLLVPKPNVGWTSIFVQRSENCTMKFEDIFGNSLLRNTDELKTNKTRLDVKLSGNMFGFLNCPNIRHYHVGYSGTEGKTIPVTFYNGLTKLAFTAAIQDYSFKDFKLKILSHNKKVQVYVCKKSITSTLLEVRHNDDPSLCLMNKEKDYYLLLNISLFKQGAFERRGNESVGKIVILSTEGSFYVEANTSYVEADFVIEEEEQQFTPTTIIDSPNKKSSNATLSVLQKKIYKLLPIIIVSSILCLVLLGLGIGAYCYYKAYRKKQNTNTNQKQQQAGSSTSSFASNVRANDGLVLFNRTPPFSRTRTNQSLGLRNSFHHSLRPPPIPEEQEDDNSEVVPDEYDEPTWWEEKFGTYINPRV